MAVNSSFLNISSPSFISATEVVINMDMDDRKEEQVALLPVTRHPYALQEIVIQNIDLSSVQSKMESLSKPGASIFSEKQLTIIKELNTNQSGKRATQISTVIGLVSAIFILIANAYLDAATANDITFIITAITTISVGYICWKIQKESSQRRNNYIVQNIIPSIKEEARNIIQVYANHFGSIHRLNQVAKVKKISKEEFESLEPNFFPVGDLTPETFKKNEINFKNLAIGVINNHPSLKNRLTSEGFDEIEIRTLMDPIYTACHFVSNGAEKCEGDSAGELIAFYDHVIKERTSILRQAILNFRKRKKVNLTVTSNRSPSPLLTRVSSASSSSSSESPTPPMPKQGESPKKISPPNSNKSLTTRRGSISLFPASIANNEPVKGMPIPGTTPSDSKESKNTKANEKPERPKKPNINRSTSPLPTNNGNRGRRSPSPKR